MEWGKLFQTQRFKHLIEIKDVNLFDDGKLYTISVLEEDVLRRRSGSLHLAEDARIINAERQPDPKIDPHETVSIPEPLVRKISRRFFP